MYQLAFVSGASSGIGRATARLLVQNKISVILNGRRQDRLQALAQELKGEVDVHIAAFDVSDSRAVEQWFQNHQELVQKVDVLVNNAGLALGTDPVHKAKWEDWEEMIDTNVKGLLHLSHQFLPELKKKKAAHIVNIGSVAGRWTYPGGAVYSATKFAVRALTEGFRMDLLGSPVRVSNIEPGMVETEFSQVRFRDHQDVEEKAKNVYKGLKPLTPEDIAESLFWILQRPQHVNIQEIVIFPTEQASIRDVHRN